MTSSKHKPIALALGLTTSLLTGFSQARPVKIQVSPNIQLGEISPAIYGMNHRYIKNAFGMWDDENKRVWPEFAKIYQEIGFKSMRYPGGTVGNTFDWKRSIDWSQAALSYDNGLIAQKYDLSAQRQSVPHGLDFRPQATGFGLHEALEFCQQNGTELSYVYNVGNGNAQDAANLIEYLNGHGDDDGNGENWARLRELNGYPQPFNVTTIEIGNENYLPSQRYWMKPNQQRTISSNNASTLLGNVQSDYLFGSEHNVTHKAIHADDWLIDVTQNSNGQANQDKFVRYPPIVKNSVQVYVAGRAWTEVENLTQASANDQVYAINYTTGRVSFGDGIHGAIPPAGQLIEIKHGINTSGFNDYFNKIKTVNPDVLVYSSMYTKDSADAIAPPEDIYPNFVTLANNQFPYDGLAIHPYSQTFFGNNIVRAQFQEVHSWPGSIQAYHYQMMGMPDYKTRHLIDKVRDKVRHYAQDFDDQIDLYPSEYGMMSGPNRVTFGPAEYKNKYLISLDHGLYTAKSIMHWIDLGMKGAAKHSLIDNLGGDNLGEGGQAIIYTDNFTQPSYFVKTPTAYVFKMFSKYFAEQQVAASIINNPLRKVSAAGTSVKSLGPLEQLKVIATTDIQGDLYLMVLNIHHSDAISADIDLASYNINLSQEVEIQTLTGPSYTSFNSPELESVNIQTSRITASKAHGFSHAFPAHSLTAIKISGNKIEPNHSEKTASIYYDFNKVNWNKTLNNSGSLKGYQGKIYGSPRKLVNGVSSKALNFTGGGTWGENVRFSSPINPKYQDFTAAVWVKFDSTSDNKNLRTILQQGETGTDLNGATWLYRDQSGRLGSHLGRTNVNWDFLSNKVLKAHTWHHVALVKQGNTLKFYIDGQPDRHITREDIKSATAKLVLGKHKDQTQKRKWIGPMDEFYLYQSALSDEEIQQLYQCSQNASCQ